LAGVHVFEAAEIQIRHQILNPLPAAGFWSERL
jgi:hypothetical protein